MHALRPCLCIALAIALGLSVPRVRADLITPDSIPNPPSAVGSANGTPVYAGGMVATQYAGLGLNFSNSSGFTGTAITNLNGVNVWAPTEALAQPASRVSGGPPVNFPVGQINYEGQWAGGRFVQPGTLTPTSASSATLEIVGTRIIGVDFLNSKGQWLGSAGLSGIGAHGGQLYTFTGTGISSFQVFEPISDPTGGVMPPIPAWGVAEVSFTIAHAPEPSSLFLGTFAALSLFVPSGWRRLAQMVAPR